MTLRQLIAEHWTKNDRLLRLTTPLGANQFLVESWHGSENLSDGFCFQLNTLSTDAHLSLKSLIGQPALLELLTAHSRTELRPFHGHINRIESVGANGGLAR